MESEARVEGEVKKPKYKRKKGVLWTDPKTGEKKRVSKTWAAAQRLKGSIIVYDPKLLE